MQPWLAAVAPHGATDLLRIPVGPVLATHALCAATVACLTPEQRVMTLVPFSIAHMRHDFRPLVNSTNGAIAFSFLMHGVWIAHPGVASTYLTCVHTPMHYARVRLSKAERVVFMCATLFAAVVLPDAEIWTMGATWVAPVIAHCVLSELDR